MQDLKLILADQERQTEMFYSK